MKKPRNPYFERATFRKGGVFTAKTRFEEPDDEDFADDEKVTGIICKCWEVCPHPELCQKTCSEEEEEL